jgi:hypothetical protein
MNTKENAMKKNAGTENERNNGLFDMLMLVLMFGSIWGLGEALLGNIIRSAGLPVRAAVLTGLGMGLMGAVFGVARKPLLLPVTALVTAATMQLAVPVLHCSFLCKANSGLAVVLHGVSLAGVIVFMGGGRKSALVLGIAGFSAAVLSSAAFHYGGLKLAPCDYLLSFAGEGGLARFIAKEGALWGLCSALMLPMGAAAGTRLAKAFTSWKSRRPGLVYGASAVSVVICLALIVASMRNGA